MNLEEYMAQDLAELASRKKPPGVGGLLKGWATAGGRTLRDWVKSGSRRNEERLDRFNSLDYKGLGQEVGRKGMVFAEGVVDPALQLASLPSNVAHLANAETPLDVKMREALTKTRQKVRENFGPRDLGEVGLGLAGGLTGAGKIVGGTTELLEQAAPRIAEKAPRVGAALQRIMKGEKVGQRIGRNVISSLPLDVSYGSGTPEESTLGQVGQATGSDFLKRASQHAPARIGTEMATNIGAGLLFEEGTRKAAKLAGYTMMHGGPGQTPPEKKDPIRSGLYKKSQKPSDDIWIMPDGSGLDGEFVRDGTTPSGGSAPRARYHAEVQQLFDVDEGKPAALARFHREYGGIRKMIVNDDEGDALFFAGRPLTPQQASRIVEHVQEYGGKVPSITIAMMAPNGRFPLGKRQLFDAGRDEVLAAIRELNEESMKAYRALMSPEDVVFMGSGPHDPEGERAKLAASLKTVQLPKPWEQLSKKERGALQAQVFKAAKSGDPHALADSQTLRKLLAEPTSIVPVKQGLLRTLPGRGSGLLTSSRGQRIDLNPDPIEVLRDYENREGILKFLHDQWEPLRRQVDAGQQLEPAMRQRYEDLDSDLNTVLEIDNLLADMAQKVNAHGEWEPYEGRPIAPRHLTKRMDDELVGRLAEITGADPEEIFRARVPLNDLADHPLKRVMLGEKGYSRLQRKLDLAADKQLEMTPKEWARYFQMGEGTHKQELEWSSVAEVLRSLEPDERISADQLRGLKQFIGSTEGHSQRYAHAADEVGDIKLQNYRERTHLTEGHPDWIAPSGHQFYNDDLKNRRLSGWTLEGQAREPNTGDPYAFISEQQSDWQGKGRGKKDRHTGEVKPAWRVPKDAEKSEELVRITAQLEELRQAEDEAVAYARARHGVGVVGATSTRTPAHWQTSMRGYDAAPPDMDQFYGAMREIKDEYNAQLNPLLDRRDQLVMELAQGGHVEPGPLVANKGAKPEEMASTDWQKLGIRAALHGAVEEGDKGLYWSTGGQLGERYSTKLQGVAHKVAYDVDAGTVAFHMRDRTTQERTIPLDEVNTYVGQHVEDELRRQIEVGARYAKVEGPDIKVGAEGFRVNYDPGGTMHRIAEKEARVYDPAAKATTRDLGMRDPSNPKVYDAPERPAREDTHDLVDDTPDVHNVGEEYDWDFNHDRAIEAAGEQFDGDPVAYGWDEDDQRETLLQELQEDAWEHVEDAIDMDSLREDFDKIFLEDQAEDFLERHGLPADLLSDPEKTITPGEHERPGWVYGGLGAPSIYKDFPGGNPHLGQAGDNVEDVDGLIASLTRYRDSKIAEGEAIQAQDDLFPEDAQRTRQQIDRQIDAAVDALEELENRFEWNTTLGEKFQEDFYYPTRDEAESQWIDQVWSERYDQRLADHRANVVNDIVDQWQNENPAVEGERLDHNGLVRNGIWFDNRPGDRPWNQFAYDDREFPARGYSVERPTRRLGGDRNAQQAGIDITPKMEREIQKRGYYFYANPFGPAARTLGTRAGADVAAATAGAAIGAATDKDDRKRGAALGGLAGLAAAEGGRAALGKLKGRQGAIKFPERVPDPYAMAPVPGRLQTVLNTSTIKDTPTKELKRAYSRVVKRLAEVNAETPEQVQGALQDDLEALLEEFGRRGREPRPGEGEPEIEPAERGGVVRRAGKAVKAALSNEDVEVEDFVGKLGRFALDPTGEKELGARTERMVKAGEATRKVQPWAETEQKAKRIASKWGIRVGPDLDAALNEGSLKAMDAGQLDALTAMLKENTETLQQVYAKLGGMDPNDARFDRLARLSDSIEQQTDQLLGKFVTARSEAGRALNILKKQATDTLDPTFWMVKTKRALGDRPLTDAHLKELNSLIAQKDRPGLAQFVADLKTSTPMEKLATVWKAGLLSGLRTHEVNFLSNVTHTMLDQVKDVPAFVADRVLMGAVKLLETASLVKPGTAQKTKALSPKIQAAMFQARKNGRLGAAQAALETLRGKNPSVGYKVDARGETTFEGIPVLSPVLNFYTRAIFRGLGASDAAFKVVAFEKSLAEQSRVLAKDKAQVKQLMVEPTDEMVLRAIEDSEVVTFTNSGTLARMVGALKREGGTGMEFLLPFGKTPANVATRVADFSPIGPLLTAGDLGKFVRAVYKGDKKGTFTAQRAIADRLGRSAVGSGIALWIGMRLAKDGKISGHSPESTSERQEQELEGKTENSVLIDGKWRSLEKLSPLGNTIVLGADMWKAAQEYPGNLPAQLTAAAGSIGQTVTEQSFLEGASQTIDVLRNKQGAREQWPKSFASSFVPTLARQAARAGDTVERRTEGVSEAIGAGLPFKKLAGFRGRYDLEPQVTQFGDFKKAPPGRTVLLDPFSSSRDKRQESGLIQDLSDNAVNISRLRGAPGEAPAEFTMRAVDEGIGLEAALQQLRASAQYQNLDPIERKEALEKVVRTYRARRSRERNNR